MHKLKDFIKRLLAVPQIRKLFNGAMALIAKLGGINRLTSTVYHWIFFMTFNREQFAVIRGRRNYYRNLKKDRKTHIELRRNIHRLEKGMSMQPRRSTFALDYIDETIEFYEHAVAQTSKSSRVSIDLDELNWAHDVLHRYFSLVDKANPVVAAAANRFEATLEQYKPSRSSHDEKAPFARKDGVVSSVSYDELMRLAMQRRSVRWFKDKKVPRELLDKALLVGRQSPTACNRMPYEFRIFDDPKQVKRVASIPFGAGGYSHQIPTIMVVVGKLSSYFSPRDRHAIYIDASLAVMSTLFALETLGLSSTIINWPDFEPLERKMQKELGLDTSDRVVMLVAIGYAQPTGVVPYSQKKQLDTFRTYNQIAS